MPLLLLLRPPPPCPRPPRASHSAHRNVQTRTRPWHAGTHASRIIEIEWAVKHDRPFRPSPKKPHRAHSRRAKGGKGKHKLAPADEAEEGEGEGEGDGDGGEEEDADGSSKENVRGEASGSAKRRRRIKSGDGEPGTPPKKRRLVKFEEGC